MMETVLKLNICELPPNIIVNIFKFLSKTDLLLSTSKTCKLWSHLSYEKNLWRKVDVQDFPDHAFTTKTFTNLLRDIQDAVEELIIDLVVVNLTDLCQTGLHFPKLKSIIVSKPRNLKVTDTAEGYQWLVNNYPELRKLHLGEIGYIPVSTSAFQNLETFTFTCHRKIQPTSSTWAHYFDFLKCHANLTTIVLRSCAVLPETVVFILTELSQLKFLELKDVKSSFDEVDESLTSERVLLENLRVLNVSETTVSDQLLSKIVAKAKRLIYLNVENCRHVTYTGFNAVAQNCLKLHTLVINDSVIGDVLDFIRCPLTTASIQRIAQYCRELSVLKISHCAEVGDVGVLAVANSCPNLTELLVAGCLSLQDQTVLRLTENCPRLQKLNLSGCVQLSSVSITGVLKNSRSIKFLDISTCLRVTELQLLEFGFPVRGEAVIFKRTFSEPLKPLHIESKYDGKKSEKKSERSIFTRDVENLDVELWHSEENLTEQPYGNHCQGATDKAGALVVAETSPCAARMPVLASHCHIAVLNLSFCSKITNADIKHIATFCPDLCDVNIQACYMVTNAGVKYLVQKCRFLNTLNISGGSITQTTRLTDACLNDIARYGTNLEKLVVVKNFNITVSGVHDIVEKCHRIRSVRIEVSSRSNISKEMLIQMTSSLKDKTACLQFRADAEILVYRNAEFSLLKRHQSSENV